ncbi:MAG: hypothetical protein D6761_00995, partial [Candidatus Dadabacteria bacterium]
GLWIAKDIGIAIFGVQAAAAAALEVPLALRARRNGQAVDYRYFWILIGAFLLSLLFWILDITGLVCDPDNHWLQGHALWHITNSTCLYWMYRYGSQFDWAASRR